MGNKTPEVLIQKIIAFIEKERELYGDFTIKMPEPGSESKTIFRQQIPKKQSIAEEASESSPITVNREIMNPEPTDSQETVSDKHAVHEVYSKLDNCSNLEELEQLCKEADVLRTDMEGTRLVFGTGNPDADLMLIGEAPGSEEDKQGEPFVGAAGKLLNKILAAIDLKREDVYIANILKHRPPNNRDPLPEERERSLPFLLKQIELVNPKLILALGKVSAQTLLNSNESLGRMRKKFHSFMDKYELMATYHPAALLRYDKWKRPTWEDVQMLRKRYDELGGKP